LILLKIGIDININTYGIDWLTAIKMVDTLLLIRLPGEISSI